jgi:precorrin-6B methylase 2
MNSSHSKLTDWGLEHISMENNCTILDVGCGGGRTVSKLAAIATQGKVYGIDYSDASVAATRRTNGRWIDLGHVEVRHASVSQSGRRRRACALASVRRPNCMCGFPACSFHEDTEPEM